MSNFKHGKSKTKIYGIWLAMRRRCEKEQNPAYKNYGGRGITVSEEWKLFDNFFRDMGEKPDGKTLERIDNNLGYSKENCIWASRKEQARNKRNIKHLTFNGVTKSMAEWSEETRISIGTIWRRSKMGWSDEEIINTPLVNKRAGIPAGQKLRYFQE
jgi:hypothetical protein